MTGLVFEILSLKVHSSRMSCSTDASLHPMSQLYTPTMASPEAAPAPCTYAPLQIPYSARPCSLPHAALKCNTIMVDTEAHKLSCSKYGHAYGLLSSILLCTLSHKIRCGDAQADKCRSSLANSARPASSASSAGASTTSFTSGM